MWHIHTQICAYIHTYRTSYTHSHNEFWTRTHARIHTYMDACIFIQKGSLFDMENGKSQQGKRGNTHTYTYIYIHIHTEYSHTHEKQKLHIHTYIHTQKGSLFDMENVNSQQGKRGRMLLQDLWDSWCVSTWVFRYACGCLSGRVCLRRCCRILMYEHMGV